MLLSAAWSRARGRRQPERRCYWSGDQLAIGRLSNKIPGMVSSPATSRVRKPHEERRAEIIGEAARKVSSEFRESHSGIEWRKISGMRDKIIHDYLGVDYDLVWDVVKTKIPPLKTSIQKILK